MDSPPVIHPLKAYRERADVDLRQEAFATLAGTTKATISRIEAGTLQPSLPLMQRIIAATNGKITAAMLVCGETRGIVELVTGKPLSAVRRPKTSREAATP